MSSNLGLIAVGGSLALCLLAGCDDVDWPEPRYVDSLRVLGVRAEPPTLAPGAAAQLSMLCADGTQGSSADPNCDIEVAWFAQCNNPVENDPANCINRYSQWANRLASPIRETPTETYPDGFGFGPAFDFTAPEDILRDEFEAAGQVGHFGTSYVFFAACAGSLAPAPGDAHHLPVECRDRDTDEALDQRGFVVGVTTLYAYDLFTSQNPVVLNPRFDDVSVPDGCAADTDCPNDFDCTSEHHCVPVVHSCPKGRPCSDHCLTFDLGLDSFSLFSVDGTRLEAPRKSLWVTYLTNAGHLPEDEASFSLDAPKDAQSPKRTDCIRWQAPETPTEQAYLWAVLRDGRGGLTTWAQRIIVR